MLVADKEQGADGWVAAPSPVWQLWCSWGGVGEKAQPEGIRSLEESTTCAEATSSTVGARGRATGGAGAEEGVPALSSSFPLCPRDGSSLPRARGRPPTERGVGLSSARGAAEVQLAGAVLKPKGWKKSQRPPVSVGPRNNRVTRDSPH